MDQPLPSEVDLRSIFNAVNANNATYTFKKVVEIVSSVWLWSQWRLDGLRITSLCHPACLCTGSTLKPAAFHLWWASSRHRTHDLSVTNGDEDNGPEKSMQQSRKCGYMATRGAVVIDNSCVCKMCKTNAMFFFFVNLLVSCVKY